MPPSARTLLAAAVLSLAAPCFGQAAAAGDICRRVLCRAPGSVHVALKDGTTKDVPSQAANPIVLDNGSATVRLGEQVHLGIDLQGDAIKAVRAVKSPRDASDAISLRLSQDGTTHDSLLVVENGADRMLKLDLGLVAHDSDRVVKTPSCPVGPGKSLYEHWPQPVYQVVVTRIRVLPAGSPATCN
ncbi:MAG: hypothetical protein ACJ8GO_17370 [Ramlibacter sp.]